MKFQQRLQWQYWINQIENIFNIIDQVTLSLTRVNNLLLNITNGTC